MTNSFKTISLIILAIAALALGGCSSDGPLALAGVDPVIDTAPPTIPTGLAAAAADHSVKVSWDKNVLDEDLYGFMVYRVVWGTRYPMLGLPQQGNQWIDDHPVNVACTYVVTALDNSGNESAWAAINFLGLKDRPEFDRDF